MEKGLPDKMDAKKALWTADFPGQSSPVIANGKLYIMGFDGEGPDLQEGVACFDAETGKMLWKQLFNDFLSDVIYLRYANSSPTIDPETGNVYIQNSSGLFAAFTADGKLLWKHSMMEEFGRMTFPNNRTASPLIDKDLVITRGITAAWGAYGPPGDRFYAFDKKTGELVWSSAPGALPQDNTFSHPWLSFLKGQARALFRGRRQQPPLPECAHRRTALAHAGGQGGRQGRHQCRRAGVQGQHHRQSTRARTSTRATWAAWRPSRFRPRSSRRRRRRRRSLRHANSSNGAIRSVRSPARRCSSAIASTR